MWSGLMMQRSLFQSPLGTIFDEFFFALPSVKICQINWQKRLSWKTQMWVCVLNLWNYEYLFALELNEVQCPDSIPRDQKYPVKTDCDDCIYSYENRQNKKVLLRERKRHTARCVANTPYVVLTGYPPSLGGTRTPLGVPSLVPPRGGPSQVPPQGAVPGQETPPGGYPDPPGGYPVWYPPGGYPVRYPPGGYPDPPGGTQSGRGTQTPPGGTQSGTPPGSTRSGTPLWGGTQTPCGGTRTPRGYLTGPDLTGPGPPLPPLWTDKHLWKQYLPVVLRTRAVTKQSISFLMEMVSIFRGRRSFGYLN